MVALALTQLLQPRCLLADQVTNLAVGLRAMLRFAVVSARATHGYPAGMRGRVRGRTGRSCGTPGSRRRRTPRS